MTALLVFIDTSEQQAKAIIISCVSEFIKIERKSNVISHQGIITVQK